MGSVLSLQYTGGTRVLKIFVILVDLGGILAYE